MFDDDLMFISASSNIDAYLLHINSQFGTFQFYIAYHLNYI